MQAEAVVCVMSAMRRSKEEEKSAGSGDELGPKNGKEEALPELTTRPP